MVFVNLTWPLKASDLFSFCVAYPLIIRMLYLIRQSWEPLYMNSTCLMDLVRVSAPEHYDAHPLWKHFQQNMTVTCEDLTGKPMQDYFVDIYHAGKVEYYIMYSFFVAYAAYGFLSFLRKLFTGKVRSLTTVLVSLFLSWNQGSLFHLFSHYQNDCSHLNGNIGHHSNFEVNGDNTAASVTLPPGLVINFLFNFLVVEMIFSVCLDYFKIDKAIYFNLSAPFILAKFVLQMKIIHPFVHSNMRSWYKSTFGEWFPIDDLNHVTCHHVSGYCLGDGPQYMWFYDVVLYVHGQIYKQGLVQFATVQHYVLNYAIDYMLIGVCVLFSFLTIAALSPLLQKEEMVVASAKTSAKKVD